MLEPRRIAGEPLAECRRSSRLRLIVRCRLAEQTSTCPPLGGLLRPRLLQAAEVNAHLAAMRRSEVAVRQLALTPDVIRPQRLPAASRPPPSRPRSASLLIRRDQRPCPGRRARPRLARISGGRMGVDERRARRTVRQQRADDLQRDAVAVGERRVGVAKLVWREREADLAPRALDDPVDVEYVDGRPICPPTDSRR